MAKKEEEVAKTGMKTSRKTATKRKTKKTSSNISKVETETTPIVEEEQIQKPAKTNVKKPRSKVYISYTSRLVFNVLLFAFFFGICLIFASKTVEREKTEPINYSDVDNTSYKVYLKQNEIYTEDYLDMNRAYVANLIDYVKIDFNYLFNIEELTNMNFDYKIIANLIIENNNGTNYVDKDFVIKDSSSKSLINSGALNINEEVSIDYDYYNSLANQFRNTTGVDTNSYLNVYMVVDKKTDQELKYTINESTKLNVQIPLSERAIEINIGTKDQTVEKQVTPKGDVVFNIEFLIAEICFFIVTCIFLSSSIKLLSLMIKIKTPYDKYVKKLLKNYDRLIVETKTLIDMNDCKVIEVKSFTELLDVRDNLKLPILYYNIVEHEKGMFYIKNNLDVYQLTIKNIDIINKEVS